ncbi:MAG: cyclic-di-AMP receptor [Brevefilum sp.]|nr:cyclic-di-AMP receptor [Brevefilum sp.]
MKMVMVVVPANTAEHVLDALVNAGHTATYAETRGGMLRQSQYSLFIALKKEQLDEVMDIIKASCRTQVEMRTHPFKDPQSKDKSSLTADIGGAVAFVWDIESIQTF